MKFTTDWIREADLKRRNDKPKQSTLRCKKQQKEAIWDSFQSKWNLEKVNNDWLREVYIYIYI